MRLGLKCEGLGFTIDEKINWFSIPSILGNAVVAERVDDDVEHPTDIQPPHLVLD